MIILLINVDVMFAQKIFQLLFALEDVLFWKYFNFIIAYGSFILLLVEGPMLKAKKSSVKGEVGCCCLNWASCYMVYWIRILYTFMIIICWNQLKQVLNNQLNKCTKSRAETLVPFTIKAEWMDSSCHSVNLFIHLTVIWINCVREFSVKQTNIKYLYPVALEEQDKSLSDACFGDVKQSRKGKGIFFVINLDSFCDHIIQMLLTLLNISVIYLYYK